MRHRVVSAAMLSYRRPKTHQTNQNISIHTVGFFSCFILLDFYLCFLQIVGMLTFCTLPIYSMPLPPLQNSEFHPG